MNVRSRCYCIARAPAACRACGAPMPVFALVVPAGHELLEDGDWLPQGECALLFYVGPVCEPARRRLAALAPDYRLAPGDAGGQVHWTNHCERCAAPASDEELYGEAGGAFVPMSPAQAAAIELVVVQEPLEADAAGYGVDPPGIAPTVDALLGRAERH